VIGYGKTVGGMLRKVCGKHVNGCEILASGGGGRAPVTVEHHLLEMPNRLLLPPYLALLILLARGWALVHLVHLAEVQMAIWASRGLWNNSVSWPAKCSARLRSSEAREIRQDKKP